jgi:hypothetical protein
LIAIHSFVISGAEAPLDIAQAPVTAGAKSARSPDGLH